MRRSAYENLFWGMIFIFFNFYINILNILPNFVGYILILLAVNNLVYRRDIFNKIKIPTIILVALGLRDIFSQNYQMGNMFNTANTRWVLSILTSLESIIFLYVIYILCEGIVDILNEKGVYTLSDNIKKTFKIFMISSIIGIIYSPLSMYLPVQISVIMLIIAALYVVTGVYLGYLFKTVKNYDSEIGN